MPSAAHLKAATLSRAPRFGAESLAFDLKHCLDKVSSSALNDIWQSAARLQQGLDVTPEAFLEAMLDDFIDDLANYQASAKPAKSKYTASSAFGKILGMSNNPSFLEETDPQRKQASRQAVNLLTSLQAELAKARPPVDPDFELDPKQIIQGNQAMVKAFEAAQSVFSTVVNSNPDQAPRFMPDELVLQALAAEYEGKAGEIVRKLYTAGLKPQFDARQFFSNAFDDKAGETASTENQPAVDTPVQALVKQLNQPAASTGNADVLNQADFDVLVGSLVQAPAMPIRLTAPAETSKTLVSRLQQALEAQGKSSVILDLAALKALQTEGQPFAGLLLEALAAAGPHNVLLLQNAQASLNLGEMETLLAEAGAQSSVFLEPKSDAAADNPALAKATIPFTLNPPTVADVVRAVNHLAGKSRVSDEALEEAARLALMTRQAPQSAAELFITRSLQAVSGDADLGTDDVYHSVTQDPLLAGMFADRPEPSTPVILEAETPEPEVPAEPTEAERLQAFAGSLNRQITAALETLIPRQDESGKAFAQLVAAAAQDRVSIQVDNATADTFAENYKEVSAQTYRYLSEYGVGRPNRRFVALESNLDKTMQAASLLAGTARDIANLLLKPNTEAIQEDYANGQDARPLSVSPETAQAILKTLAQAKIFDNIYQPRLNPFGKIKIKNA